MEISVYRSIFEMVSDGVVVFGSDLKIMYRNQKFLRMFGLDDGDHDDVIARLFKGPENDPQTLAAIDLALTQGSEFAGELFHSDPLGEPCWTELSFKPMRNDDGTIAWFVGFLRDVTLRKQAERRVVELERDYEFIVENVLAGIIIYNPDSTIRYINPKARHMLGLNEDGVIGQSAEQRGWSFVRPDGTDMPAHELPFNRALTERQTIRGVLLGFRQSADDVIVWAVCNSFLALDQDGEVEAVLVSFSDVSRLIESEREASIYRERFELAARASQDVIFEWNITTGQFFANEAFETVYGYPPPDIMGTHNLDARNTIDSHQGIVSRVTLDAIASGQERFTVDHMIERPDGSFGHVVIRAFIVRAPDGTAVRVIGTATDIGNLTAALRALEESEARFRIIADTVSDVIWDHNINTGESWMSPDWAERLNLGVDSISMAPGAWGQHIDPADRERVVNSYNAALASDAHQWEIEYRLTVNGRSADVAVKASILRNPDGSVRRVLGNVRDMTAIKRQQEGYTRSRALEAVGQLTGGVAHDFNNLLMIIQGNAEMLGMSALAQDDRQSVELISRAAQSAARLTRSLLTFSGQTRFDTRCINLPSFTEAIWPLVRAGLPESIAIKASFADNLWQPDADANNLEQAIVNIAMNAKDAMPGGGAFAIQCENLAVTQGLAENIPGLAPGNYVVMSFSDTGSGMSPIVQARAFEPYFTTKEFGKGTGLGLSTVYGFATQSGGATTIHSVPGEGTTVRIYLPVCNACEPEPVLSGEGGRIESAPSRKRILVVEDQAEVRTHVVRLLTRMGYAVEPAENAAQALAAMERGPAFDLLFTDIIMPGGMNGQQLSQAAKKVAPSMKVLFTSGYPATAFEHLGFDDQNAINLLAKPYKSDQLNAAIARTLSE